MPRRMRRRRGCVALRCGRRRRITVVVVVVSTGLATTRAVHTHARPDDVLALACAASLSSCLSVQCFKARLQLCDVNWILSLSGLEWRPQWSASDRVQVLGLLQ